MSYDEKIVLQCQANALANNATLGSSSASSADSDGGSGSSGASSSDNGGANSTETCSTTVAVGLYYNDVWEYDLNCTRLYCGWMWRLVAVDSTAQRVARADPVTSHFVGEIYAIENPLHHLESVGHHKRWQCLP